MEYYPHHIGDFAAATAHLSNEEITIYLKLMWMYYDAERPLEDNLRYLARKVRATEEATAEILAEFFELNDGEWHHGRIDGELEQFHARVEQASQAGKASARARRKKRTGVQRPLKSGTTETQLPITQDPLPTTQVKKGRFAPPALDQVKDYWQEKKLNGDPAHFFDHFENCDWRLSGGKGAKMKKWTLAANNWSRNQAVFDPKSGGHKDGKLVLPRNRDGWQQFAEIHKLPKAQAGESFDAWGGRLQSEIERRHNV